MSAPRGGIVIAGGGTGGHLMPGLAVARVLTESGAGPIVFVGTMRGLEARLVPEAGYALRSIAIGGLKGGNWTRRLTTLAQLPRAIWESVRILRETRARVVFGIGGYASGPALAAAALLRIPVVVLEVNARSGLANRLAAPWVKMAAVNFPETARDYRRAVVTGIPVRAEFLHVPSVPPQVNDPIVLVMGGSQGAWGLNLAVTDMVQDSSLPFRVRLQTGGAHYPKLVSRFARLTGRATAEAFIQDVAAAMAEAAVVVCRAGASTLGELAAAGRAAILVPFPGAADQHQLRNARTLERAGAAVVIEQNDLTPTRLKQELRALLSNPARRLRMEEAMRAFAHPRAAREIADLVLDAAHFATADTAARGRLEA